jgi:hypothetical protein
MASSTTSDPFRADAAVVYRFLRDFGPSTVDEMADRCFPLSFGRSDPLYARLIKGSKRRVLDSLVWMRHSGVALSCVPGVDGSIFHLGAVTAVAVPSVVTPEVSQTPVSSPAEEESDAMDLWHGR